MSIVGTRTPLSASSQSPAAAPSAGGSSWNPFRAPAWVQTFYAKFPLVVLDQEDEPGWKLEHEGSGDLWVHPPCDPSHPLYRPWASASPSCLRIQLLFLLRHAHVKFRPWKNEAAAPDGVLPALHTGEQLVSASSIRSWLDAKHPLKGRNKDLQGMPSQEAYDHGVALAQLVLGHLLPALEYTASSSSSSSTGSSHPHLVFPNPPPLLAGLTTPLPAALTGDARDVDRAEVIARAKDALDAVHAAITVDGDWALGAKHPTPLDALLASHVYPILAGDDIGTPTANAALSAHLARLPALGDYVDRVLSVAGAHVR